MGLRFVIKIEEPKDFVFLVWKRIRQTVMSFINSMKQNSFVLGGLGFLLDVCFSS